MLKHLVMLFLSILVLTGLAACDTFKGLWDSRAKIESMLAVAAAGKYSVLISKDGVNLYQESWNCVAGPDGKLGGCHKVAESPPPPELEPLSKAPRTLKVP